MQRCMEPRKSAESKERKCEWNKLLKLTNQVKNLRMIPMKKEKKISKKERKSRKKNRVAKRRLKTIQIH